MKKPALLFSFIILFLSSFGQGWEKKYPLLPNNNEVKGIIELRGGGYAFVSQEEMASTGIPNSSGIVTRIDASGNLVWSTIIPAVSGVSTGSIVMMYGLNELQDSSLVVLGYNYDATPNISTGFFTLKIDKNGNVL